MDYLDQAIELLNSHNHLLTRLLPSEWTEMHRTMSTDQSPFPGKFSYDRTPYLIEPVNCLSPDNDARIISVMKGAQIGFSTGVIESGIGYIISQQPGNIMFLTGHGDLSEEAVTGKIDPMIDSCGLRPLIRPNALRKRNSRTGDTSKSKEFPGGKLIAGSATNHKLLRQRSIQYGFIDDFDAAPKSSKESGDTRTMIEGRFAAYLLKMKLYYISTPEVKQTSNIEPVYLLGDQRKYHVPCPCCGDFIYLDWKIKVDDKEVGGITWKVDDHGRLIDGSVGYVCQSCSGFFNDQKKYEMNLAGIWKPTAEPSEPGMRSYHIPSLYAPPGMYDWEHYVRKWIGMHPKNGSVNLQEKKAFYNTVLGRTWEERGETPKANKLQLNQRNYEIGVIPSALSVKDGNGQVVLITCGCDLNGKEDDARLDYEITAWTENGSSYSVQHGSIGTFVPREGNGGVDRERFTYRMGYKNSVWPLFEEILKTPLQTDEGETMPILFTGVDCGFHTQYAYAFIDGTPVTCVGLKGKGVDKSRRIDADTLSFKPAKERNNLYLVEVNQIKDELAQRMKLVWDERDEIGQPYGFMNFPDSGKGLYGFKNFFSHFESEQRTIESDSQGKETSILWKKTHPTAQNHLWDCHVYNMALKDIAMVVMCKDSKLKYYDWKTYCDIVLGRT